MICHNKNIKFYLRKIMESDELLESDELQKFLNQKLQESEDGTIELSSNIIRDEGAQLLAEKLKQGTTLTRLYLADNGIGDEGAKALVEALEKKRNSN